MHNKIELPAIVTVALYEMVASAYMKKI